MHKTALVMGAANMSSVQDYMNARMVMRDSKASVLELAKVMVDWNVSSVAITDEEQNNKIIGILTELDIIKSIAKGVPPDGITAGSIMSSPILSVRKDQPIEDAALLMIRKKVRHLLVEDPAAAAAHNGAGVIIGIITTTDLARYLKKRMKEITSTASSAVAREDDEKVENEQQQTPPQRESSSELLSEVWELYF
jgi:predicted transcriptional regulator